jgi:hypothetical protein
MTGDLYVWDAGGIGIAVIASSTLEARIQAREEIKKNVGFDELESYIENPPEVLSNGAYIWVW